MPEILTSYDFSRAGSSGYDRFVELLVDDGVAALRLKRGEDFPEGVRMTSVQAAVSDRIRKRGRRARTRVESDDAIVVSLWPEGAGPKIPRRRQRSRTTV